MKTKWKSVLFLVLILGTCLSASPIVFSFINPSFGGHPSNAGWLMQSALSTQKRYVEAPEPWTASSADALKEFEKSLNRQILSTLARKIVGSAFGEDGLGEGEYEMGNYSIDISYDLDGISVTVEDTINGNSVNIKTPYY